jgi:lysophospholipid acyltransferase (LPLAT)-like uncharacterized protein
MRLHDRAGVRPPGKCGPVIWVLWHNRFLAIPATFLKWFRDRPGGVMVSRSKDGELLAYVVKTAGGIPVRGSSSRGGASALAEFARLLKSGVDAYITPDGPRGPRYSVHPGALWLAAHSGAPIMPVSVEASSCWRLKSWDGLIIPKPFARVDVTLHEPLPIAPVETEEQMAAERERLREILLAQTVRQ